LPLLLYRRTFFLFKESFLPAKAFISIHID
jgi:hypothetical protein